MSDNTVTPSSALADYHPIEAALASIEKYRGILFDCKTEQGMKEAKAVHREVSAPRIALEKARKQLKEDVLTHGRLIDNEASKIARRIAAIEEPLKAQIDAEERRVEQERQAAILAEQRRLAAEEATKKEAEEKRLAEERAKLARERAEFEQQQAKARAALEEEERQRRAKIEEEERKAKAARQAEEDRLRAEREKLEAERRAKEAEERRQREAQEAAEREQRRLDTERQDSRQMLETFCKRFGHIHPELAEHIGKYLTAASVPA